VCGAAGTLVLGYGPNASPDDSDVLRSLQDLRKEGDIPGHASPRESTET
jgi:hypothetical protein